MGRYENVQLQISNHAHKQYCQRVKEIKKNQLTEMCQQQLFDQKYSYNKEWFFHLDGVWWVYEQHDNTLVFITCYGRTTADLPAALKWASRNNDRINLSQILGIGGRNDEFCPADPG